MPEQTFFPVISSDLTKVFPELKGFILSHYDANLSVKKGENILFPEDFVFFYLSSGKVKSYAFDEEGHERLMYIFIKDTLIFHPVSDHFGKNLVALENASIYSINAEAVFQFLQQSPAYIATFIKLVGARYGVLLERVLVSQNQNAKHKLYTFLETLARLYGQTQPDGSVVINKIPTLTDIAAIVNVHRSNVTAYFNELENQGVLQRQRHKLVIYNIDKLHTLIEDTSH